MGISYMYLCSIGKFFFKKTNLTNGLVCNRLASLWKSLTVLEKRWAAGNRKPVVLKALNIDLQLNHSSKTANEKRYKH